MTPEREARIRARAHTKVTLDLLAEIDRLRAELEAERAARAVTPVTPLCAQPRLGERIVCQRADTEVRRVLEPDPETLAIIERIKTMRAGGMTLRAIADALNAEGVPSFRGKRWWPNIVRTASLFDGRVQ